MAATYDNTLSEDKDVVRFLTGDTDTNNAFVQDEEINGILDETGSTNQTVAWVLRHIATDPEALLNFHDRTKGALSASSVMDELDRKAGEWM